MGLDSFALDTPERFRAWRGAGLRYFLGAPGADRFAVQAEIDAGSGRSNSAAKACRAMPPEARKPTAGKRSPQNVREPAEAAARKPEKAQEKPEPTAAPEEQVEWPTPWDVYRLSLNVPCRTVWTYWDLGYDMGGMPSDARRELLFKIFDNLYNLAGWRRGSVTFWPMAALTASGKLDPDPERFWKGVRLTGASHVVVYGRRAFEALFPEREFEFRTFRHDDKSIVVLPGPGNVLADRQNAKKKVWETLRSLEIR